MLSEWPRLKPIRLALLLLCLAGMGIGLPCVGGPPPRPTPAERWEKSVSNLTARTMKDDTADRWAFHRRVLVEEYQLRGAKDPAWDEDVLALLESAAIYRTNTGMHFYSWLPDPMSDDQWRTLRDELIGPRGCPDLLVAWLAAVDPITPPAEQRDRLLEIFRRLEALPADRRYSDLIELLILHPLLRWLEKLSPDHPDLQRLSERWTTLMRQHLLEPTLPEAMQRALVIRVNANDKDALNPRYRAVAEQLQAAGPERHWMANHWLGEYYIELAWQHRGSRRGNQVTPEGWKGFHYNLAMARGVLENAYLQRPHDPRPASLMITVCMGQNEEQEQEKWFERSTRAVIDYDNAYNNYLYALFPRWGGSHAEMLRVAMDAYNAQRWDTALPDIFFMALTRIAGDDHDNWSFLHHPEVQDAAFDYLSRKELDPPVGQPAPWFQTQAVALRCEIGQWDQGKLVLDRMQGPLLADAIDWLRLERNPYDLRMSCITRSVPEVDRAVSDAYDAGVRNRWPAALEAMDRAIAAWASSPKRDDAAEGDRWLRDRRYNARVRADLADTTQTNPWVNLMPDADMAGWEPFGGTWTRNDDGTLAGTSDTKTGLFIRCKQRIGPRASIRARIELLETQHPQWEHFGLIANSQPTLDSRPPYPYMGDAIFLIPFQKAVSHAHTFQWHEAKTPLDQTPGRDFIFQIDLWDQSAQVRVDHAVVIPHLPLIIPPVREHKSSGIILGGKHFNPNTRVIIHEVSYQPLTEKPAWAGKPKATDQPNAPLEPDV